MAAGAAAPFYAGFGLSQTYSVETSLGIDAAGLSKAEKLRAVTEAGKSVRSAASLDGMVRTLGLARDREFSVAGPSAVGIVSDIVTGREMTVSAADAKLRERLSAAFTANADASGDHISIAVETAEAGKSVRIARVLADAYERELASAAIQAARSRTAELERAMHDAETAVGEALAKGGDGSELRRAEQERRTLEEQISMSETALAQLRDEAKALAETSLADILARPLPAALEYSGLDQLRRAHVDAKLLVDQLSVSLGPRHPRLLAARAALDEARDKIGSGLKQMAVSLKQQEATAAQELAGLKAQQSKLAAAPPSAEAAALADLQAASDKARTDYLQAVQRLDAAALAGPLTVKVDKPATVEAATPVGMASITLSAIGALAGLALAALVAFATRRRAQDDLAEFDHDAADGADDEDLFAGEEIDLMATEAAAPLLPMPASQSLTSVVAPHAHTHARRPIRVYHAHAAAPSDDLSREIMATGEMSPAHEQVASAGAALSETPLADRVRELLLANRIKAAEAQVPPLVAAVMAAGEARAPHYGSGPSSQGPDASDEKVGALRRDMEQLRQRVAVYTERRVSGRR